MPNEARVGEANGRVYDPLTAMFFSPDPLLTDAGNWLDYNRYGYCLNNPFRYTDPSGYTWWAENWQPVVTTAAAIVVGGVVGILAAPLGVIATGMLAGAAGGMTAGVVGTAVYGGSFNDCIAAGLQGAILGGISGALTAGIGSYFGGVNITNTAGIIRELERAGAHALVQGTFTAIRGGNFWEGAAAGLVSSIGGTAAGALHITSFFGTVAVTSFMGGVGTVIAGGKSAEEILFGMVSGAMVGALNFAEHANNEPGPDGEKTNDAKPTTTVKKHYTIAKGVLEAEAYGTQTVEGSPNVEVIKNATTGQMEAEVSRYFFRLIKVTTSADSFTIGGNGASIGMSGNKITFDATVLKWGNSGWGFSISFDSRLALLPIVIYYPQPVLQMFGR